MPLQHASALLENNRLEWKDFMKSKRTSLQPQRFLLYWVPK